MEYVVLALLVAAFMAFWYFTFTFPEDGRYCQVCGRRMIWTGSEEYQDKILHFYCCPKHTNERKVEEE